MARLLVAALALFVPRCNGLADTDTITWGGDNSRAGYQTNHNMDPSVVNSDDFGQIFKTALPGNYNGTAEQIFSQPLVYTPSSGTKQYVYFATTQNNVYKLDAATGAIVASRNLAIPFLAADLDGCVDINPHIGITSTGVIDPDTDTLYLTSKTYADQAGGTGAAQGRPNGRYYMHALSVDDLAERDNFPVNLEGIAARNNPVRTFNGGIQHQRPALLHAGQYIYAGFASHCVQYNFTGWLMGFDKTSGAIVERYATEGDGVPNTTPGGGIWMSGGGLASDDKGSLFFATGNGYASQLSTVPVEGRNPPTSLEEAAVHMSLNGDGSVTIVDFFMPQEKQALDGADKDLGTSPLEILPSEFSCGSVSRIGVVTGKSGKTYWLNLDDLGGYRTGANSGDNVLQVYQNENSVYAGAGVYPLEGGYIYINVIQYPTHVFKFSCDGSGVPSFTKVADSPQNNAYTLGVSHGTVTSLRGQQGTGLLWTTDVQGSNLRIYDAVPADGALTLLRSFSVPGTTKFTRAVFGDGRLYMGTTLGYVYGFGGPNTAPLNCSSPHDFGNLDIHAAAVTTTITCKAVIATTVHALNLTDPGFSASTTTVLPKALAVGATFSFSATFEPSTVGLLTGAVSIATTNGVAGYTSKTAVLLEGTGTSADALLAISATKLTFNDVIVGQNDTATSLPIVFSNEGSATLDISAILFSASASGPWTAGTNTSSSSSGGSYGYEDGAFVISGVPSSIAPNSGKSVTVYFNPTAGGNYTMFTQVVSSGGNQTFAVTGNAGPAATCLVEFQTPPDGTGWVAYQKNANFTFGSVTENTARYLKMRITNNGTADTVPLSITVSKPPFGVPGIVQASNNVDLAEGTILKAGESATATLYCAVPKAQWNTDTYYGQANWTLNTNDPVFDKQHIQFSCEAVAEQAPPLQADGQGTYRYAGCYKENNPGRQLSSQLYSSDNNTAAMCIAACAAASYTYCGTQYNRECWAGNTVPVLQVAEADCNYPCTGDINQICGGNGVGNDTGGAFISLFANPNATSGGSGDGSDTSGPVVNPGVDGYISIGCYHEPDDGRALPQQLSTNQTVAACLAAARAKDYVYAGTEYGGECWAGNTLAANATAETLSTCSMPCNGNASEYCGGSLLLNMYKRNSTASGTSGGTSSAAVSSPTAAGGPYVNPGVSGYSFVGCYNEPSTTRAFANQLTVANQTVASCIAAAKAAGYSFAGLEYGGECWAGQTISPDATKAATSACSMTCNGNTTEYCGGSLLLDVYQFNSTASASASAGTAANGTATHTGTDVTVAGNTTAAVATVHTAKPTVAASWTYLGCYTEGTSARALAGPAQTNNEMTYEVCADFCADYAYFGVEYGDQCYCGNYLATGAGPTDESQCSTYCAGDASELCGNGNRLNVYRQGGKQTGLPVAKAQVGSYGYRGCYSEGTEVRALGGSATTTSNMTQEYCASFCAAGGNFTMFGVEYATQCYCGNALGAGSTNQTAGSCSMACGGDAFELCGGGNLLNVWTYNGATTTATTGGTANARIKTATAFGSGTISTASSLSNVTASAATTAAAAATTTPTSTTSTSTSTKPTATFAALNSTEASTTSTSTTTTLTTSTSSTSTTSSTSAITNGTTTSALFATDTKATTTLALPTSNNLTTSTTPTSTPITSLTTSSTEATTSSTSTSSTSTTLTSTKPTTSTASTSTIASTPSSITTTTLSSTSTIATSTSMPAPSVFNQGNKNFTLVDCYQEPSSGHLLSALVETNNTKMTVGVCLGACLKYQYAGLEGGKACWCGNALSTSSLVVNATRCNTVCTGNATEYCGATGKMLVYNSTLLY